MRDPQIIVKNIWEKLKNSTHDKLLSNGKGSVIALSESIFYEVIRNQWLHCRFKRFEGEFTLELGE